MPQPDLIPFEVRGLLMALTGVTLDPALHSIRLLDGSSSTSADKKTRNVDSAFQGGKPFKLTNHRAQIKGGVELTPPTVPGHATNGIASADTALKVCAFARTLLPLEAKTTYSPVSVNHDAFDAIWHHAGSDLAVDNGRGDLADIKMEIGESFMAQAAFEGNFDEVEDAAIPDYDYAAFVEPTIAENHNTEMVVSTIGSNEVENLHLRGKKLVVSQGNQVKTKVYTEHKETGIGKRNPTFTATFAKPDLGEFNPESLKRAHSMLDFSFKLKEPDGRYSLLRAQGQIETVAPENVDDDYCLTVSGECIPIDGGDEYGITFGNDTLALQGEYDDGTDDVVYSDTVSVSGLYTGTLTWSVIAGTLPTGLSINAATGAITGTPTAPGTYNFTVHIVDDTVGTPRTAEKAFTVEIAA